MLATIVEMLLTSPSIVMMLQGAHNNDTWGTQIDIRVGVGTSC